MWEGEDEGTQSYEETPNANQPWTVHPAAKVADEDDEDGVADLWREQRDRVRPETLSSPTHSGNLTVPFPGKAEREEAAQWYLGPRQSPRVSLAPRASQWDRRTRFSFPLLSEILPSLSLQD